MGRVEDVDVDREIDGRVADSLADALDDALGPDLVDRARLDEVEAAVAVVVVVRRAGEGGADTGVDRGAVGDQALLGGVVDCQARARARVKVSKIAARGAGVVRS